MDQQQHIGSQAAAAPFGTGAPAAQAAAAAPVATLASGRGAAAGAAVLPHEDGVLCAMHRGAEGSFQIRRKYVCGKHM
jgi:hypothetical protein